MPTDDTVKQHQDAVTNQSHLMTNVAMPTQQPVAHQTAEPGETVVSQLNIRQRASGMIGEVNQIVQMKDIEVRQQSTTNTELFDEKAAIEKFLSGNEPCPEWDSDELEKILNDTDCSEYSQPIGVTSFESCVGESVFQTGEQNLMMEEPVMEDPVVSSVAPPALSSAASGDVMNTSYYPLYSPSPHITTTQPSVAMQSPLSPTGVAGTMLQELKIDNGSHVELAVSGSVGRPIQLIRYVPMQVNHILLHSFLDIISSYVT